MKTTLGDMASARAAKHIEAAKECSKMVRFYHSKGDSKAVEYWRGVWAEKIADAKQITNDVWRHYK
jgi:hypothetical protein